MMRSVLDEIVRLLVCAIGVGLLVRVFQIAWGRFLHVEVSTREASLLAAGVIGVLAGLHYIRDYAQAATIALSMVGTAFLIKWLLHLVDTHMERKVD